MSEDGARNSGSEPGIESDFTHQTCVGPRQDMPVTRQDMLVAWRDVPVTR